MVSGHAIVASPSSIGRSLLCELRSRVDQNSFRSVMREEEADAATATTPMRPRAMTPPTPAAVQGSFVVPFEMGRDEAATLLEAAPARLPDLLAECSTRDLSTSGWRRVKPKKGASAMVRLWEKDGGGHKAATTSMSSAQKRHQQLMSEAADMPSATSPSASSHSHSSHNHSHSGRTGRGERVFAVRSSTTVLAPLDAVLKVLDTSVATACRSFTKIIHGSLVADSSVLFHNHPLPHASESLAVRWMVCRCHNAMVSDCDFCLLEYSKVHSIDELPRGQRSNNNQDDRMVATTSSDGLRPADHIPIAYKLMWSTESKDCPELLESHRLVRARVPLGGFLCYPTDHCETTDVVFFMSLVGPDKRSNSLSNQSESSSSSYTSDRQFRSMQRVLQQLALGIGRLGNAVDAFNMSLRLEALRSARWVENTERTQCVVCCRRFHQLTRRRHHCRLCGDVICRDCSVYKDADLPNLGPMVLRICALCNAETFKASGVTPTAATASGTDGYVSGSEPAIPSRRQQRSRTVGGVNAPSQRPTQETVDAPVMTRGRRFSTGVQQLPDQTASCPKPSDRDYFNTRWQNLAGNKPEAEVANNQQDAAPINQQREPASVQGDRKARFKFRFRKRSEPREPTVVAKQPQTRDEEEDEEEKAEEDSFAAQAINPTDRPPLRRGERIRKLSAGDLTTRTSQNFSLSISTSKPRASTLGSPYSRGSMSPAAVAPISSSNQQQHEPAAKRPVKTPLVRRAIDDLTLYEDILLKLCESTTGLLDCKYAALSLFTRRRLSGSHASETVMTVTHFLSVNGSNRLIKAPGNMMCCEPVLHLKEPVVTRNALNSSPIGYDLAGLPIVVGPQHARFYAGIPLVDSKSQYIGALAIFDSKTYMDDDIDEVVPSMEAMALVALASIETRKTERDLSSFMKTPFVHEQSRQSEPVISLSLHDLEVDDEVEEVRRFAQESPSAAAAASAGRFSTRLVLRKNHESPVGRFSSRMASPSPHYSNQGIEFYKHKMKQLVQQAQETQVQMMQNAVSMNLQSSTAGR